MKLVLASFMAITFAGCSASDDVGESADDLATQLGYVRTPSGYRHSSCVHEVEDDALVGADGTVTRTDGTSYVLPACNEKPLPTALAQAATNGWVAASEWVSPTWIRKLTANFTVPAAPSSSTSNQLLYFFPGLEPATSTGSPILQPVLQWGVGFAGGGSYWAIASWDCHTAPGPCTHTALTKVASGDKLHANITGSSCTSDGACTWKISISDTTTNKTHSLGSKKETEPFRFVQGAALEAYRVTKCSQYPADKKVEFTSIAIYDGNLARVTPTWDDRSYLLATGCTGVTSTATTTTLTY